MNAIARRVAQARQAIVQAALTAGRDPGEVTLVAATKTQTDDAIRQVIAAGVTVCRGEPGPRSLPPIWRPTPTMGPRSILSVTFKPIK